VSASAATLAVLVGWGTVVGLDLVSVPQAMIARPLVAATVAGAILGDVEAGLRLGVVLELFALDVLPVGAVRYPDYGPATVGATLAAVGSSWQPALGVATAIGLVVALIGGMTLQWLRHRNARAIQARAAALAAGSRSAVRTLQYQSIARDALRSAALTGLALLLADAALRWLRLDEGTAVALTVVAAGAALSAVVGGALRSAGHGARVRWLAAGGAVGLGLAALA
jgi:mannose/fructose/N-acetylgalactosamine-specific phosphotransferase system component IIC